jgi:two-component system sensor histidine kinase GlrK
LKLHIPTSILQLTLIGFSVVMLPLIAALVFAVMQVDGLAGHGRQVIFDTAQAVQASRIVVEQVSEMERSARQFLVLRDTSFYQHYLDRRADMKRAIEELLDLNLDAQLRARLDLLIRLEQDVYRAVESALASDEGTDVTPKKFPPLVEVARPLLFEISQIIARDTKEMRQQAKNAQRILLMLALALIPASFVLAALFTVLITRPLRRIDQEIRRLGSGEFSKPIQVGGPADLRELSTRLDWLRTRLNELEQQKKSFLRDVSHELKTPLSAIREGVELLNDGVVGNLTHEQAEVASILLENSVQLQQRIEDLLKFNIVISQSDRLHLSRFKLDEVIRGVIADHRLTYRSRKLVIDSQLARLNLFGDREKIRIIADNLLSNAIKFSPAGGTIRIGLTSVSGDAILDVQDEGPGIDPGDRSRIFEAFYQGYNPHSGHVKGTGLGLAIAKEYVKMHNGRIKVIYQLRGAHIRVRLPLERAQAA